MTNRTLKVGDVLKAQYGDLLGTVNFWQVTSLVGKASVAVRPIATERAVDAVQPGGVEVHGSGHCIPGHYTGPENRVRVSAYDDGVNYCKLGYGIFARKCDPKQTFRWSS